MAFNLVPLYDQVIVKRVDEKEVAKGGIIIPDTAKEKPLEGEVLAVGAGKLEKGVRVPLELKVGDRVLLKKWSGTEYDFDGEDILIIKEDEILAKFAGAAKAAKK
jgi:chaperonin GroES